MGRYQCLVGRNTGLPPLSVLRGSFRSFGLSALPHFSHWSPYASVLPHTGTGALDVAVGEELLRFLVVVLLLLLLCESAVLVQLARKKSWLVSLCSSLLVRW